MRFARVAAATAGLLAAGTAGVFFLAPEAAGQSRRVIEAPGGNVEVFAWHGGAEIGVSIRDVEPADVTREKLAAPAGAVVEEVRGESAAAKAGLKPGDIVLSFDGERVRSARQLERLVEETPAGRTVKLAVQRGGSQVNLEVTPESSAGTLGRRGEAPFLWRAEREAQRSADRLMPKIERDVRRRLPAMEFDFEGGMFPGLGIGRGRLGVSVMDLSDQLATHFGVKAGVLVAGVDADSPAAKAGIKAGDVITAVNGQAVEDPEDLRREVSRIDEGTAADLSLTREKKSVSVKVEVEKPARKVERRVRRTV